MGGKAYRVPGAADRLRKQQMQIKDLQAINRLRNTPRAVAATAFAGISAAGDNGSTGNFLATKGDTMIGPFALAPPVDFRVDIDGSNTIDIGESSSQSQYSSNIQLDDTTTSDILDIIKGAAFDGQILVIRTFAPTNLTKTIRQATLANGGNVQTLDENDIDLGDLQLLELIFDDKLIIFSNTGGTWRVRTPPIGGGGGLTEPVILTPNIITPQTLPTTSVVNWANNPNVITLDRNVEFSFSNLPTSGKYEGVLVIIDVDGTGGYASPVWPISLTNPPIVDTTANTRTSVMLYTIDGGTTVTHATSVGSSTSGGATVALDNLVSPTLNVGININSKALTNMGNITYGATGFDIANTTNPVDNFFVEQVRFRSGTIVVNVPMITSVGGNSMNINHPTGSSINFSENGTANVFIDGGGLITSNNLILQNILTLNDNAGDPLSNGQFARNSIDVKVFSGGAVRNLSNIGAGSPLTTKGDIFTFDTADARLPVGTNGQVLTANSAVALGVEWATGGGGGGATTELDNLTTTAINASLLFGTTGLDIGNTTNPVDQLFFGTGRLQTNLLTANAPSFTTLSGSTFDINFPTGSSLAIYENAVSKWNINGSRILGPNIILDNTLTINDSSTNPAANGQFSRNGSVLGIQIPEFSVRRDSSVAGDNATINLVKVDPNPVNGEDIAEINFQIDDSGVITTYGSIAVENIDISDNSALSLNVRADNGLISGLILIGDDNNQRIMMLMGGTDQARIQPVLGQMGYFVTTQVTDFSLNIGTAGSLEIPQINDGNPSVNDLNSGFGAFDGAIGQDIADGDLYIRKSASVWSRYVEDSVVT